MGKIHTLSQDLVNKIAAGEVVERPASVVKELIENSLDACASEISITIEDSGKQLIRVQDNGEGMDEQDARAAILPHATSKIAKTDDLFSISTLGFRGEALASIAAVSQLSLITKQQGVSGFNLVAEGSQVISEGVMAAEQGTIFEVRNLFFNTPARKKFLKSDGVELRHIIDVVTHYALINPTVRFRLTHEGHEILLSARVEDMLSNIAQIYGVKLARDLLEINYRGEDFSFRGFICKPHHARSDKSQQALFVNGRWVKSLSVSNAISQGYHSTLLAHKHPIFVLSVETDPSRIDVNVHPQKTEIKFDYRKQLEEALEQAVHNTLSSHNLIPIIDDFSFVSAQSTPKKNEVKYSFEKSKQTILHSSPEAVIDEDKQESSSEDAQTHETPTFSSSVIAKEEELSRVIAGSVKFPEMKILGQIHKTFFVAETPGGILFIDQHVVQERVLYEQFMQQYMHNNVATQTLLRGEVLELTPLQSALAREHRDALFSMGFALEEFGEHSFALKTVPTVFGRLAPKEMVLDMLEQIGSGKTSLENLQEEIITRMSCRASVKAGDTLSIREIESLLKELEACELPYTCPHGRAIVIKLGVDELEKKFSRKK